MNALVDPDNMKLLLMHFPMYILDGVSDTHGTRTAGFIYSHENVKITNEARAELTMAIVEEIL